MITKDNILAALFGGSMAGRLTQKQKIFCQKYLVLRNATEAAILAGYSPRSIRNIASVNLTKANIKQYIDELNEKTETDAVMTVSAIL